MTNDSSIFCKLDTSVQTPVRLENGEVMTSKDKGTIVVPTKKGTKYIKDVLLVPDLAEKFLSVAQMIKNGYSLVFENNHCTIYDPGNKEIAKVAMENKNFSLKWNYKEESLNRAHTAECGYGIEGMDISIYVHSPTYIRKLLCETFLRSMPLKNYASRVNLESNIVYHFQRAKHGEQVKN
ncbi:hypothetical protein RND81_11G011300 [Saponaria officinalis]|uniref:Retrovirus-related Pol polyprotein from transposon TNT 1-94-like beta-barrel domain-containing protein n=1 Tax=Saponaria officinalis TaxID=3572 RepID=A0AAW1HGL0_SAPOF